MQCYDFEFKGGVVQSGAAATCKFLLFLLNGNKEISLREALKSDFVGHKTPQDIASWNSTLYTSKLPIVKLMIYEASLFGKPKLSQSFFMILGKKLERKVVTIKPRNELAKQQNFVFKADACFMKKSEILEILDPESISAKIVNNQLQPPIDVLKEIITIERVGVPVAVKQAAHGGVRKLRIR